MSDPARSREDNGSRSMALMERVVRFMNFLRRNRFPVHTVSEINAARALTLIDIEDQFQFYMALRVCMVIHHTHLGLFNRLYMKFWGTGPRIPMPPDDGEEDAEEQSPSVAKRLDMESAVESSRKSGKKRLAQDEEAPVLAHSIYESLREKDFERILESEMPLLEELLKRMRLRTRERKGRRFKPSKRGSVVDLRRSMRDSTQRGGEIVSILRKEKKPKETKLVLLADVSGSMDVYSTFLIQFVYQLQRYLRGTETFVFGTRVMRITDLLHLRSVRTAMSMVSKRVLFWSGGTDIGGCFQQFAGSFGAKYIKRNRILVILSDGWDKGDVEVLRSQMNLFKRKFKKVIWLNPNLKYERYQPLCMGMAAALPYVDHFLPCHNVKTLEQFVETVKR
ncbi:conserved hypothetical protein [Syntrophobacter sp. SbD1]|nr:conserved hypothetical protein [Syntrophobacter sp. SbD1]